MPIEWFSLFFVFWISIKFEIKQPTIICKIEDDKIEGFVDIRIINWVD